MSIVEDYDETYEGTEPIEDAKENYKNTQLFKFISENLKSKQKQSKKVFNNYGLGVLSYFNTMETLIKILFASCLLALPLLVLYFDNDPDHGPGVTYPNFPRVFTMGNFGQARHECKSIFTSQ